MKGAHSISTRRAYGVQRVCRVWHRARSSVYARRQATTSPCRRGPVGAAPDDVLVGHIGRMLEASPFHGEGYRKAWAKLRVEGIRTSQERVRRLMREHALQAPHRVGHAHGPKAHDGTITTEAPDVMWGTDMTTTVTVSEGAAFVFVAVDHCTTECIGLHAAKRGTRFEALEPIRQGVRERFGEIGDGVARGLRLPHEARGTLNAEERDLLLEIVGQGVRPVEPDPLRSLSSIKKKIADLPGSTGISRDATLGGANDLHGSGDSIGPCPRSPDPRSAVRGRVSRERPPRTTKPGLRDDLRDTTRDLASAASRFPGAFPVTAESAQNTTRKRR